MTIDPTPKSPLDGLVSCGACGAPMEYEAPTQDHEASYACRSGHTSGGDSRPQSSGTEPIPPAILPTYEGQTWIDIDRLNYRFDRAGAQSEPGIPPGNPVEDAIQPEQTAGNDSPHGGSGPRLPLPHLLRRIRPQHTDSARLLLRQGRAGPGSGTGSASIRQRPWCWPVACSAVPSASPAGGCVPSAVAFTSPSPYLQGSA